MAFDFDAQAGRVTGSRDVGLGPVYQFDGVHGLWLHPVHAPGAGMNGGVVAWVVGDGAVPSTVTKVRRPAAGIPIQKQTRPTVMVHGNRRTRERHGDFEDADEFVFENNFVGVGRDLHGVIAVGELRFVLSVGVKMPGEQSQGGDDEGGDESSLSRMCYSFRLVHGADYSEVLVDGKRAFLA